MSYLIQPPLSSAQSIHFSTSATTSTATAPAASPNSLLAYRSCWSKFSSSAAHRTGPSRVAVTAQHISGCTCCRDLLVVKINRAAHNHRCGGRGARCNGLDSVTGTTSASASIRWRRSAPGNTLPTLNLDAISAIGRLRLTVNEGGDNWTGCL
jgi:hypothetical protein